MKLAAIYNVWDGEELLKGSIEQLSVDLIIIVWQDISNFGQKHDPSYCFDGIKAIFHKYTPVVHGGSLNEIKKRQIGLDIAKREGCTHFLHMDCDEYYFKDEFKEAKEIIYKEDIEGSVASIYTYFKDATFRMDERDGYYVPFIHKLKKNTTIDSRYPYYVDPTRRINCNNVVNIGIDMHHYSWCRKDISKKINNSTAKNNIKRGSLMEDYSQLGGTIKEGYYIKDFDRKIIFVKDYFEVNAKIKNI